MVVKCLVAVLALLFIPASLPLRAAIQLDVNSQLAYQRAQDDNARWKNMAITREAQLVKEGDQYLKNKDYARARGRYQEALDLTYTQWEIKGELVSTRKIESKLNTGNTNKARQTLKGMDALIRADAQQEWKKRATTMLKQADAFMAQKNPARAYAIYTQIVTAGDKEKDVRDAASVDQAKKKQQDILKTAADMLTESEKSLAAGKATDAVVKLNAYLASYDGLQEMVPDLKARSQKLAADPAVVKEVREQDVRKEIALGDAALGRGDYISALRRYRQAARKYPETDASHQAADKITQLNNDPKAVEGLRKQEAENSSRSLFLQAETFRSQNHNPEAAALYQELLKQFPDSSYAVRAKEAVDQLGPQPAPTALPAAPPPETEEEAGQ